MGKHITFWLFAIITLVAFSYGAALSLRLANTKRITLADYYRQQANGTRDPAAQNIWLIKSDALSPNKDIKVQVALNYFRLNQPEKAKNSLLFAGSEDANYLLAQYYLLNQPSQAAAYIEKVADTKIKDELRTAQAIIENQRYEQIVLVNPKSDIGVILSAGNSSDTIDVSNRPFLKGWITNIPQNTSAYAQTLNIADKLIRDNQPRLAIYVLENLTNKIGPVPIINSLKANAFAELKDYTQALKYQNLAIGQEPENITIYQAAIIYARKAGDASRGNFLSDRLQELRTLQN